MAATHASLVESFEREITDDPNSLFTIMYSELRRMAKRELAKRGGGLTIGATTLLHEAYLDISQRARASFPDRHRFMAYAARVMRGVIIDHVRNRHAQKRGGQFEITTLNTEIAEAVVDHEELSRISEAVDALAAVEPRLAQVVELKFFGGFSFAEIAAMHGVSERTVQRDWEKARIYLFRALN